MSTTPEVGYVDSCTTQFAGRSATGPWLNVAAGTWSSLTKPVSAGSVAWPNATCSVKTSGNERVIDTNDLPIENPYTLGCYHGTPDASFTTPRG